MREYDFSHWKKLPKVSCQCITYGRPELLNEALECFLRQDYPGEKELVILNDQAGVKYTFKHPEVNIVNTKYRYATVGEKRNECVKLCSGSIICPWDDDDISLPWRISVIIQEMKNCQYFKPKFYYDIRDGRLNPKLGGKPAHAQGGWSRKLFDQIQGYAPMQSGQDTSFERKVGKSGLMDVRPLPMRDNYYIRRWRVSVYHLSAHGVNRGFEEATAAVKKRPTQGTVVLKPGWFQNYEKLILDRL